MSDIKRKAQSKAAAGACAVLIGIAASPAALATDGYFAHGYGMKSLGMGGASVARTDDAFGGANNPAQGVFVGDRLDLGVSYFQPTRGAERSGPAQPDLPRSV